MNTFERVTIEANVHAPIEKVWDAWNNPTDVMQWNAASDTWHCPASENDLREGGKFKHRMEAKDGSFGFDFEGIYDTVLPYEQIAYTMADHRQVITSFKLKGDVTHIVSSFDAETENDVEMQRQGWQAILNNFKQYVESK